MLPQVGCFCPAFFDFDTYFAKCSAEHLLLNQCARLAYGQNTDF